MKQYLSVVVLGVGLVGAILTVLTTSPVAAQTKQSAVEYDSNGNMKVPTGFRSWVYIEKKNVDAYMKTGTFPEGTVIVKELTRVLNPVFPDSSRKEPSGRGYFNGAYNGIDLSIKDSKRFAKTNGWGYFTFGHHPLPYEQTAAESPVTECAGCHIANVANTDMTWIQFYPLLRDGQGY